MTTLTPAMIDAWADDAKGPVALHLKQKLVPVEGEGAVIFPPTYAPAKSGDEPGYNIDQLSDGTKVVTIDSVGSQANRMEPIFKRDDLKHLVPQITITYGNAQSISILEAGHRLGDAIIRSTELQKQAHEAFQEFQTANDPSRLAKLGPTSLLFGVWDSRDTQAKLPRIVQAVIRAWDVDPLKRSAQYKPAINYREFVDFDPKEVQAAESNPKSDLAQRGFVDVPATGAHGGVIVRGEIVRDVTVNLVALRRLGVESAQHLRRYILGLALVAAVEPPEAFLRQGCLLVPDTSAPAQWHMVDRHGKRAPITLNETVPQDYAKNATAAFGRGKDQTIAFSKDKAKEDVKKADKKAKAP